MTAHHATVWRAIILDDVDNLHWGVGMRALVRVAVPTLSLFLLACGPAREAEDGGSTSNVMPSECTLSAMVAENMVAGTKVGTASGSITCPRSA